MSVSVVIPAYNEESTVGAVVSAALAAPQVQEVIVVDDGSDDATAAAARRAGARVVSLGVNAGKGAALRAGVEAARGSLLVLLDADLLGLAPEHVGLLVGPVAGGTADMTVGIFRRGRPATDLAQFLAPHLSGQRALRRADFLQAAAPCRPGFAVEVALNAYARRQGLRVVRVPLTGVSHRTKEEKRGWGPGLAARLRMYYEIWRGPS